MDAGAVLRSAETRIKVTEVTITPLKVILEIEDVEAANRHE